MKTRKAILYFYADKSIKKHFGSYDAVSINLQVEFFDGIEDERSKSIKSFRYRLESQYSCFVIDIDRDIQKVVIEPVYIDLTSKCRVEAADSMLDRNIDRTQLVLTDSNRTVLWALHGYLKDRKSIIDMRRERLLPYMIGPAVGTCFFCTCNILILCMTALIVVTQFFAWY